MSSVLRVILVIGSVCFHIHFEYGENQKAGTQVCPHMDSHQPELCVAIPFSRDPVFIAALMHVELPVNACIFV